ncbi:DUF3142 domain-containing protein [Haloferula sp. A504]|uniref:DUF3142 domain-containing protein n=1 Tax=Haloferula sp. A504 TaxID=3373601 RepID=UPI0031C53DCE|nr:DUF3142 domain-containing protein [Verrucomicrobiaceae bacterium E54]
MHCRRPIAICGPLLAIGLTASSCDKHAPSEAPPPLTAEAYVWQDPARPEVREAVAAAHPAFGTLHFRAAEFRWTGRDFAIDQVVTDRLPSPGCGLVVRIGQSAAQLEWTDAQCRAVEACVASLARLGPREIQCDYDCPQARLGDYCRLLKRLRAAAGAVPVVPTTLPSWLAESGFAELAEESPGYVLQVHSLTLPRAPEEEVVLLDPALARRSVDRAAALGVPFRVAMPTYGCEVWFDAGDRVIEVISEDRAPEGLAPARRSYGYAEPAMAAKLVGGWIDARPAGLTGVIWYRLPIASDRRNWAWPTLQKVMRGEIPKPGLRIEAAESGGDVALVNHGDAPARLPLRLIARGPIQAADAIGAYRLESGGTETVFRFTGDGWPWIEPANRLVVGWITTRDPASKVTWEIE